MGLGLDGDVPLHPRMQGTIVAVDPGLIKCMRECLARIEDS